MSRSNVHVNYSENGASFSAHAGKMSTFPQRTHTC